MRMPERSGNMDQSGFDRWTRLIRERTGLRIPAERKGFLSAGLRERMRASGCDDLEEYFERMRDLRANADEWSLLVDRLTVHETRFFRHAPSLELVEHVFLPQMRSAGSDPLQVWSVGCATGEEAYTLAILMEAARLQTGYPPRYAVTGTDISLPALRHARRGCYAERQLRCVPDDLRSRFFSSEGGGYRISPALRERTAFFQLNLLDLERYPLRDFHLIYCQNVLIYFDRSLRLRFLAQLADRLVPGGMLVLGPGDVPVWSHPGMERVAFEGTLAFRRLEQAEEEGNQ